MRKPRRHRWWSIARRDGWYRKTFNVPLTSKGKLLFIDFDGVYRNGEVGSTITTSENGLTATARSSTS